MYETSFISNYSQSTSCVTSISENEMNIRIPLFNVRHLNGILNISDISLGNLFEKDALTGKKRFKILGKQ